MYEFFPFNFLLIKDKKRNLFITLSFFLLENCGLSGSCIGLENNYNDVVVSRSFTSPRCLPMTSYTEYNYNDNNYATFIERLSFTNKNLTALYTKILAKRLMYNKIGDNEYF